MSELSPEDKAHVNRIVDAKMETMQREVSAAKLKSPMRAALGAIQQAEREEIRRQALREAADACDGNAEYAKKERAKSRDTDNYVGWGWAQDQAKEDAAAILALIDAPAPERPAIVPDPDDKEQVAAVALALFEMDKVNWIAPDYSQHETYMRDWARRTLSALAALTRTR